MTVTHADGATGECLVRAIPDAARVLGVGIDIASVGAAAASLRMHGEAYLRRVCSPSERLSLPSDDDLRCERLAVLWAAKEAATKTLAPTAADPWPWHDLDVRLTGDDGTVHLTGHPARVAARSCIATVRVQRVRDARLGQGPFVAVVALAWGVHAEPQHRDSPTQHDTSRRTRRTS